MPEMQPAPSDEWHDPGGKSRLKLQSGVIADAVFLDNGKYRPVLTRRWTDDTSAPYVLWVGMNPSVAGHHVDDPTVRREIEFTRRWGYRSYVKCNVMDYYVTEQKRLLDPHVIPCSPANLPAIRDKARSAAMIVLGFGALHKKLQHFGDAVCAALIEDGHTLWCLKLTKSGNPGHPLYVAGDTPPMRFSPPRQG